MPLGTVLALFRVGDGGYRGVVWAEDGVVFLAADYTGGGWHALLSPYNGYVLVGPRTIAALLGELPIAWHGVAVNLAAAAAQAAVACFAFHVVRANTRGLFAPVIAALAVLLVPVGGETAVNLASLQWFLLLAGGIAPFWTPAGWSGRMASIAFVLVLTTSCPFGGVALLACAVAWLLSRSRFSAVLTAVAAVGTALEAVGIVRAPARTMPADHSFDPIGLARAYVVRIAGDGVFGLHFHDLNGPSESLWPGLVVLAVTAVLAVLAVRQRGWLVLLVPAILVIESVVTFVPPMVLGGVDWRFPIAAPRYYVAPTLLLVTAIAVLTGQLGLSRGDRDRVFLDHPPDARPRAWAHLFVAGLVVCGLAVGWSTSYTMPASVRNGGPAWATEVRRASSLCSRGEVQKSPLGPAAPVRIAPDGWVVVVPCARLRG